MKMQNSSGRLIADRFFQMIPSVTSRRSVFKLLQSMDFPNLQKMLSLKFSRNRSIRTKFFSSSLSSLGGKKVTHAAILSHLYLSIESSPQRLERITNFKQSFQFIKTSIPSLLKMMHLPTLNLNELKSWQLQNSIQLKFVKLTKQVWASRAPLSSAGLPGTFRVPDKRGEIAFAIDQWPPKKGIELITFL